MHQRRRIGHTDSPSLLKVESMVEEFLLTNVFALWQMHAGIT